jgi:ribosomal protein L11
MIKRKYFLKDIEVTKKDESGELVTIKADRCFTEESSITVKMPTFSEKLKIQHKLKNAEKEPEQNYQMICDLIDEVDCVAIDNNERISTLDDLTAFGDGSLVIEWLTALLGTGFVPKKKLTV